MKLRMRRLPSLQRKLVYILAAFVLSCLIYLLLSTTHYQANPDGIPDRGVAGMLLRALQTASPPLKDFNHPLDSASHDRLGDTLLSQNNMAEYRTPNEPTAQRQIIEEPQHFEAVTTNLKFKPNLNKQTAIQYEVRGGNKNGSAWEPEQDPYTGPENEQQKAIVEAFMHAWSAYKTYAWGHDELKPLSGGWKEWFGVGITIVDSLDTMWIMGLKDEFKLGRDWVAQSLKFDRDVDVQLFEIVIRELGGLMSAYHLSKDKVFLDKAVELSDKLMPCFDGRTKIPCNRIDMHQARPRFIEISTAETGTIQLEFRSVSRASADPKYEIQLAEALKPCLIGPNHVPCRHINMKIESPTFDEISVAEIGTLQLEFRDVARQAKKQEFEKAVEDVSRHLHSLRKLDGLVPCFINPTSGNFRSSSTVSMGASADSYYEYLLKQWLQTGKTQDWLRDDYLEAMAGMKKHLYKSTQPSNLNFVGSLYSMNSKNFKPEMEHLACFLPGTLALGYIHGLGGEEHLQMAANLTRTCYEMYARMPTGLSPEIAAMNMDATGQEDIFAHWGSHYNLQRPETVESLFYLYRATGDNIYRDWGWKIFQAFEKYTRVEKGYASIDNVKNPEHVNPRDKMETFYLAETLKYLYLLFSDNPNLIPLDKFVINTEAHPLPIYSS